VTRPAPWGPPPAGRPLSPEEQAALAAVYAEADAALADVVGACRACGRCCRFRPGGIVLFATALEMAYLAGEAGSLPDFPGHAATGRDQATPWGDEAWTCPYQQGALCLARERRTLGCRTHFCEARAGAAGEAVHARAIGRLRCLAEEAGLGWYGPVAACLASWAAARR
jgi:hypothetical protein